MSWTMFPVFFNFTLFAVLLYVLLRKPVVEMVEYRHLRLKDEVERAQTQLVSAQKQLQEFEEKLRTLTQEKANMISFSKKEAELAAMKIVNDAQRVSKGIVADAGQTATSLKETAVLELKKAFATAVLSKAEISLKSRLTGDDRVRIMKEFSGKLEGTS